jgi:cell division protein FtsL
MSLPAREAERWATPAPPPIRRRAVAPARAPATRPPIPNPPRLHRRARRGHHSAFWVLTAVVVSTMVVGLVSLNAMRIDAAYKTRLVTEQVGLLADERRTLVNDVAHLSSPSRIGTWARAEGLENPAAGDVVILQVPGTSDSTASSTAEAGG